MAQSREKNSKLPKIKLSFLKHRTSRCMSILINPLRMLQFLVVLLLFAFTIYMVVMDPTPISTLACILLIVLSGVYIFVLAVELISHFAGSTLHVVPMSVFSLMGLVFFGTAGILLVVYGYTHLVVQMGTMILCLLAALFFLLDIAMVFAFWKKRCSVCKRCCQCEGVEHLPRKIEEPRPPSKTKMAKRSVTTSLSDVRVPAELKSVVPDHSMRKIEKPRRREYVDSPTCVPSICSLSIAQIQTEPCKTSVVESQTPSKVVKEAPIQTFAKCEFCHQVLQTGASPASQAGATGWSYPAIVQFIRGDGMPCCTGCKCATVTTPQQQQEPPSPPPRPLSTSRKVSPKESPVRTAPRSETSKRLSSEATQQVATSKSGTTDGATKLTTGVAQTVTRLTLASFYVKPDKKTSTEGSNLGHNPAQNVEILEAKREVNLPSQELTQNIITMLAKDQEPVIKEIIESVDRKQNNRTEEEKPEEPEGNNSKIERSKGGGEECQMMAYHQFMRASEERSVLSSSWGSPRHNVGTQISATLISPLASCRKPRFLHLKSNKVDPIRDADISDLEDAIPEIIASRMLVSSAIQKDDCAESTNLIEHRMNDVCLQCKRQSSAPTSANYCNVFKDKRGRHFCEFCAPADSKKVTSRLEVTDLKKLRCANCRSSLRARGVKTSIKLKSDVCPKCGQSQRPSAASPSSM